MEVHVFTEYQGSTEQDYRKIAKGCEEEATIKNDTHQRRGQNILMVVCFTDDTDVSGKKEEILSRDPNKHRMIPMISDELREIYCYVVNEQLW